MKAISEKTTRIIMLFSLINFVFVLIAGIINAFILKEANPTLELFSKIAAVVAITPIISWLFLIPAGLLFRDEFGEKTTRIIIYYFFLPSILFIALAVFENCFNFLPNYHEAAQNGASKEIVNEIAKKSSQIGLAILVTSYIFLIGSGKLFAKIWGHKIKG